MSRQGILVLLLASICISSGAVLAAAVKQGYGPDTEADNIALASTPLHAQHMSADRKLLGVQAAAAADDNIRRKPSGGGGGGGGGGSRPPVVTRPSGGGGSRPRGFYTGGWGGSGGWGRPGGLWGPRPRFAGNDQYWSDRFDGPYYGPGVGGGPCTCCQLCSVSLSSCWCCNVCPPYLLG